MRKIWVPLLLLSSLLADSPSVEHSEPAIEQAPVARPKPLEKPAPVVSLNLFVCDIARYYCDAGWICKAFKSMPLMHIIDSWTQLVLLMASSEHRWFYAFDSAVDYGERCNRFHRTYEAYERDSVDAYWLSQYTQYHQFFTSYVVDVHTGVLTEKTRDYDKTRYTELLTLLWSVAPAVTQQFYLTYFEQLVTVLYKKMNYAYENHQVQPEHILGIANDKKWLKKLYMLCVHQQNSMPQALVGKLAYHYRRADEVYALVTDALLTRVGL